MVPVMTLITVISSFGNMTYVATIVMRIIRKAAPKVPIFRAACGLPPSLVLTKNVPIMETTIPMKPMTIGR